MIGYLNGTAFGVTDPVFERDLSFYVFTLPFWRLLHGWATGLVTGTVVLALTVWSGAAPADPATPAPLGYQVYFGGLKAMALQAELDLALREGHTVIDWVDFPDARYEAVEGDREILQGISVLATPGHTPGHQSVTVRTGDGLVLIVGQAAQDARSFATGPADASIERLRELNADRIHFSHDRAVLRRRK